MKDIFGDDIFSRPQDETTDILAAYIRSCSTWNDSFVPGVMAELADRADMLENWNNADGDNFEDVAREIQKKLNIDLGL